jgi:hypothetical protein
MFYKAKMRGNLRKLMNKTMMDILEYTEPFFDSDGGFN